MGLCNEGGMLYNEGRRDMMIGQQTAQIGRMEINAGQYDLQQG